MSRIKPASVEQLAIENKAIVDGSLEMMGFIANDVLIMAKKPELLNAFSILVNTIYQFSSISEELKSLIGLMVSTSNRCEYCMSHTFNSAIQKNVAKNKIECIWEYESNDQFTNEEKAALKVAWGAGQSPNSVSDSDYENLRIYFDENQQLEIIGIISLFGFLNRWNSTLKTDIESISKLS